MLPGEFPVIDTRFAARCYIVLITLAIATVKSRAAIDGDYPEAAEASLAHIQFDKGENTTRTKLRATPRAVEIPEAGANPAQAGLLSELASATLVRALIAR